MSLPIAALGHKISNYRSTHTHYQLHYPLWRMRSWRCLKGIRHLFDRLEFWSEGDETATDIETPSFIFRYIGLPKLLAFLAPGLKNTASKCTITSGVTTHSQNVSSFSQRSSLAASFIFSNMEGERLLFFESVRRAIKCLNYLDWTPSGWTFREGNQRNFRCYTAATWIKFDSQHDFS